MDQITDNIKLYLEEPLQSYILVPTRLKKMEYQCRLSVAHHLRVFSTEDDMVKISQIHSTDQHKTRLVIDGYSTFNPMLLEFLGSRHKLIGDIPALVSQG